MTPEKQFERELEVFRTEAESASQFLFGYFSVHAVAHDHDAVHRLLNTAPLFWNTALAALQQASLIALGRMFDQNSVHNIDKVLGLAQQNLQIFTKQALGLRRQGTNSNPPEWLDEFLKQAYVPTAEDFRRLRRHVKKRRRIYEDKYRDIRHKFVAHKEISDSAQVDELFSKTNVQELRRLVVFLQSLHEALWQLYYNGRKPTLTPMRHSVKRMRDLPSPQGGRDSVQERIVHEAEEFLLNAAGRTS
jgi:AbiU2